MKRTMAFLFAIVALNLFIGARILFAEEPIPQPVGYVNDFAAIIPDDVEQNLEKKLRDYEAKTTNEIAVVTVKSLGGETIEQYSIRLAEKWKVGKKDADNGIILVVAPNERKVRIEVGYGFEGIIPDATAKIIIEREIIPHFKKGNMPGGIMAGIDAIIARLDPPPNFVGDPQDSKGKESESSKGINGIVVGIIFGAIFGAIACIVFIVLGMKSFSNWRKETKRRALIREGTRTKISKIRETITRTFEELNELGS